MKNHLGVVVGIAMVASAGVVVSQLPSNSFLFQGDLNGSNSSSTVVECEKSEAPACGGECPADSGTVCTSIYAGEACTCLKPKPDCPDEVVESPVGSATASNKKKSVAFKAAIAKAEDDCGKSGLATPDDCPDECPDNGVKGPIPSYSPPPSEDTSCKLNAKGTEWTCTVVGTCLSVRICGDKDV